LAWVSTAPPEGAAAAAAAAAAAGPLRLCNALCMAWCRGAAGQPASAQWEISLASCCFAENTGGSGCCCCCCCRVCGSVFGCGVSWRVWVEEGPWVEGGPAGTAAAVSSLSCPAGGAAVAVCGGCCVSLCGAPVAACGGCCVLLCGAAVAVCGWGAVPAAGSACTPLDASCTQGVPLEGWGPALGAACSW